MADNIAAQGMMRDLVNQFSDPLAFLRELIQNSIDAGSNRIDVRLNFAPGPKPGFGRAVVSVEDDGCGMDEEVIDKYLLVLFRSTKENDLTKIGKFGVGFLSVFSMKPELVRLYTAKNMESWRLDFPDYRSYNKYRMPAPRDGTLVEVHKEMAQADYAQLSARSLTTIKYWCRHADTRIFFRDAGAGRAELLINEPFSLPGGESLRYAEEGTEIVMGFSARERTLNRQGAAQLVSYDGEDKPFFGFYNRGLTLKEGKKVFVPGVEFKIKSRYLEHTITRDNVLEDENYGKAMEIIKRLAKEELPGKLRPELEKIAAGLSRAAALRDRAAVDGLVYEWVRRKTFMEMLCSRFLAGLRLGLKDWKIIPTVTGAAASTRELRGAWDDRLDDRLPELDGEPHFITAPWPGRVSHELCALGVPVVLDRQDCDFGSFIQAADGKLRHIEVSRLACTPAAAAEALPPGAEPFLSSLGRLGARISCPFGAVRAGDFDYEGSSVSGRPYLLRREPFGVSLSDSGRGTGDPEELTPVVNCSHPYVRTLIKLHSSRPGFSSFVLFKAILLGYGGQAPENNSKGSNLSERCEKELLTAALELDQAAGRSAA